MAKSTRKKSKIKITSNKIQKKRNTTKSQIKAQACVQHLLELHKVQEVLLVQLTKEV